MSRMIWSNCLVPGAEVPVQEYVSEYYGEKSRLPRTQAIPTANEAFLLPDPRAVRSMSRQGILLTVACLPAKEALAPFLAKDPFSVGVYCAVENGAVDFPSTKQLLEVTDEAFAERYKRLRNPKMYLKQLPNLAAAQMGIFLNLQGPMNVYNHSTAGSLQALDQAESDLANGLVDAALVCGTFSFEDPLLTMRTSRLGAKGRVLSEGAACLLLTDDGKRRDWASEKLSDPNTYYGIAQEIVSVARGN